MLLIPKFRLDKSLRSINGSSIVNSLVRKTANATIAIARQTSIYGADHPSELVTATPSASAYKRSGKKIITEINQTRSNLRIFLFIYSF